jgi:hypothetical protein
MEQCAAEKDGNQGWSHTGQDEIEEREQNTDDKSLKR